MDILTDIMQNVETMMLGMLAFMLEMEMLFQEKTQLNCEHYKNGLMCMDGRVGDGMDLRTFLK